MGGTPRLIDVLFSDHRLAINSLVSPSVSPRVVTFTYRNIKKINSTKFESLLRSTPCFLQPYTDPDLFAAHIDRDVTYVLDILAPLQKVSRRESLKRTLDWHSPQSLRDKRECRRLERKFIRTGDTNDHREWRKAGRVMIKSLAAARRDHFSHAINDLCNSAQSRWFAIRNLLHSTNSLIPSLGLTADMFNQFFIDKLSSIASNISSRLPSLSQPAPLSPLPHSSSFSSFSPAPLALADSLLLSLSKPSPLDIVPCSLLKSCHSTFSVLLTKLANLSFASGKFPDCYKVAQISPLLKKSTLDPSVPSSYRPIANLRTLGKLLERLAQAQLRPYLLSSPAFSPYQSAYRPGFSTETAALFITNNLLRTSAPSLLVSLDLSSAFDCVLHTTLLDRLSRDFSLSDLPIA